jgi:hypothetical protein
LLALADASWREVLTKELEHREFYKITARGASTRGLRGLGKQVMARGFYYMSVLLPSDHKWMSEPPEGFVPYVRVRPEHRSLFEHWPAMPHSAFNVAADQTDVETVRFGIFA